VLNAINVIAIHCKSCCTYVQYAVLSWKPIVGGKHSIAIGRIDDFKLLLAIQPDGACVMSHVSCLVSFFFSTFL
jgi:hypothetical protein